MVMLSLGSVTNLSFASAQAQGIAAPNGKTAEIATKNSDSTWEGLSPGQQKTLAPLESDWSYLPPASRKKWIQVANLYPKMSVADQQRLQSRMNSWSNLSQKDRRIARENYLSSLKFPADKKAEAWSAYQKLDDEQKKKLAQAEVGKKKPTAVTAPTLQQHPINPSMTSQLPARKPKIANVNPTENTPDAPISSVTADGVSDSKSESKTENN
jgi:hypothetical protein